MSVRSAVHGAVALTCLAALCAPVALADPAGKSTTDQTIRPAAGSGYATLEAKAGERYTVRTPPAVKAAAGRAGKRTSLAFFGQLTDPQIADEMSPARVDFLDPAGNAIKASWRPQEAFGPLVFDQTIRNMNANRTSEVAGRGSKKAKLGFAITTGDLADNQQLNETRWFKGVLEGGTIDPFSGKAVSASNPCAGSADEVNAINAAVAARQYTGARRLRRLPRRARRPFRRVLGPGRGGADGRPLRRVPALPRPDGARAEPVHRRGPEGAVVHRPRQP